MAGVHPWPGESQVNASLWDTVILGGHLLPGKCEVAVTGELEVDKPKAGNQSSSNLKIKGFKPREIAIKWSIWDRGTSDEARALTADEWSTMQEVLEELEPINGKAPTQPMAVYSPKLAARGVTSILITKIVGPDYEQGVMKVELTATEFHKVVTAPKGTGTAKTEKATAPGSEWEQLPNANGEITTTATKSSPHKTETKP